MSAPDITREIMEKFADLSGDAHLTIVLGAGASAPSGLPTWDEFAVQLAVRSGLVRDEASAKVLLSKQDPAIVLEAAHSRSGPNWAAFLVEALYGSPPVEAVPSPLHLAAVGHYGAEPQKTTLATLNFDGLLEDAGLSIEPSRVIMATEGQEEPGALTVHHLHGAVYEGQEYSAVVGYNDFADLVADPNAWQREFLSKALARGPLILAGTSYRDPDIRHWLHMVVRDEEPAFQALVTIVREGLGLDRKTFGAIDAALVSEWESIGLQALILQDLSDVALVIRELRHAGSEGYLAPAERARRVWDAHRRRFSRLQQEYVAQLESDASVVAAALGGKVHRATFWLANPRGRLARWASQGTRYASIQHLKLVPTGHDSPWIAGEAIASEEVLVKGVERVPGISPTWRSVLAIPIFAGDGTHSEFATGVLTFGLSRPTSTLLERQDEWSDTARELSTVWETRVNDVAFPTKAD